MCDVLCCFVVVRCVLMCCGAICYAVVYCDVLCYVATCCAEYSLCGVGRIHV